MAKLSILLGALAGQAFASTDSDSHLNCGLPPIHASALQAPAEALPTCDRDQIVPLPPVASHPPWTHEPYCVLSPDTNNPVCLFTNENYNHGRGINIITQPHVAKQMIHAGLLINVRDEEKQDADRARLRISVASGRGVGVFASGPDGFKAGERIMVDYPSIVIPSGSYDPLPEETETELMWRGMLQSSAQSRNLVRNMAKSLRDELDEIRNVVRTNAYSQMKGGAMHDLLFAEAGRINHACVPNATTRTVVTSFGIEVIALRDIAPGEEILVSYLDAYLETSSKERHSKIMSTWNFQCACSICADETRVAESDARRRMIKETREAMSEDQDDPKLLLQHVEKLLMLYDEEGMVQPKAGFYRMAAHAANFLGRDEEARAWAEKARKGFEIVFGFGSDEEKEMRAFLRDPTRHPSRG